MSKFSTIQELTGSDITQGKALMNRYHKSSSLPIMERRKNVPTVCCFRRDRVLRRLMRIEMDALLQRFTKWGNEIKEAANVQTYSTR